MLKVCLIEALRSYVSGSELCWSFCAVEGSWQILRQAVRNFLQGKKKSLCNFAKQKRNPLFSKIRSNNPV